MPSLSFSTLIAHENGVAESEPNSQQPGDAFGLKLDFSEDLGSISQQHENGNLPRHF